MSSWWLQIHWYQAINNYYAHSTVITVLNESYYPICISHTLNRFVQERSATRQFFIIGGSIFSQPQHPMFTIFAILHITHIPRPRQNGRRFADDNFKRIFLNENVRISIEISLKFLPKGPINNIPALVQIMAWRRSGDKPLSEPMMVSLLTHICVTRPQWVQSYHSGCNNLLCWMTSLNKSPHSLSTAFIKI